MENGELGEDLPHGFLVEEQTFVVNHEDVTEEENNSDSNSGNKNAPLREQDRFLPIANIAKIMKRAIPENGKIAKDARECVQECISEFISFVTSEASDRCLVEKRKTINGEDVLFAMNALGFDNYVEPLKLYLKKYRDMVLSPVNTSKVLPVTLTQKPVHTAKPVSLNKLNNAIVVFEEKSSNDTETEIETQGETTIIYTYPKDLGNFTIG